MAIVRPCKNRNEAFNKGMERCKVQIDLVDLMKEHMEQRDSVIINNKKVVKVDGIYIKLLNILILYIVQSLYFYTSIRLLVLLTIELVIYDYNGDSQKFEDYYLSCTNILQIIKHT